jgi:hypothetical protein
MKKLELLQCIGLDGGLLHGIPADTVLVLLDGRRRYLAKPGNCPLQQFEFEIRLSGFVDGLERPFDQPLGPLATG